MLPLGEYYSLLHAFDRLGRRLYPTEWTGEEFEQRYVPSPEEIASVREPIDRSLAAIAAEQERIRAEGRRKLLNENERDKLAEQVSQLTDQQAGLRDQLLHMWKSDDESYRREHAAYRRRLETEATLIAALNARKIQAQYGRSLMIDWPVWCIDPGFRYNLSLSAVRAPRYRSGLRHAIAWLPRADFDKWLKSIPSADPVKMSWERRCEVWLSELVRNSNGKKPSSKATIHADAKRHMRGLPYRTFEKVWEQAVPPEWRKRGAPKTR